MLNEQMQAVSAIKYPAQLFAGLHVQQPELPENLLFWGSGDFHTQRSSAHHHRFVLVTSLSSAGKALVDSVFLRLDEGMALLVFPFQFHHYADMEGPSPYWTFTTFELADAGRFAALRNTPARLNARALSLYTWLAKDYHAWNSGKTAPGKNASLQLELLLRELAAEAEKSSPPSAISPVKSGREELVAKVSRLILERLDEPLPLEEVANALHVSPSHLRNSFKSYTGMGLGAFIRRFRVNRACALLVNSASSVGEIASLCGFDSIYSFTRAFKNEMKLAPTAYRKKFGGR